jgi:hypothetical protein
MALPDGNEIGGDYSWARVFIEVALRAMRRLHLNYGWWDVGHHWLGKEARVQSINTGRGIELADERTVCAAISQEFLASPFTSGLWVDEDHKGRVAGKRYWKILREVKYAAIDAVAEGEEKDRTADYCLRRYRETKADKARYEEDPEGKNTVVEAKRTRVWTPRLADPSKIPRPRSNVGAIKKDIAKLRRMLHSTPDQEFYAHLLVWNVFEKRGNRPQDLEDALRDKAVRLHQTRWLPLTWTVSKRNPPERISRWLWIALLEVGAN